MRSRVPSGIRWTGHKTKDEILDDPLAESLYGLFLKVKDSPRHIAFKPETLINEVYYICNCFYQDADPCAMIDKYAYEIESDLGWRYATDLVMSMAYVVMYKQRNNPVRIERLMRSIETIYGRCCYWEKCHLLLKTDIQKPVREKPMPIFLNGKVDLREYLGKHPVFLINNVEQFNAILGKNAKIKR